MFRANHLSLTKIPSLTGLEPAVWAFKETPERRVPLMSYNSARKPSAVLIAEGRRLGALI